MPESETESKSGRRRASCPKCAREVTFRKDGNPLPHNSPSGKDGASQRCPASAGATPPVLRPRRPDEMKGHFIEDPSGLGGVLSCGGCGDGIRRLEVDLERGAITAEPCGCAVCGVPVWAWSAAQKVA